MRRAERDRGDRPGLITDERARLKELERENGELRRANKILRKASAYFCVSAEAPGRADNVPYVVSDPSDVSYRSWRPICQSEFLSRTAPGSREQVL